MLAVRLKTCLKSSNDESKGSFFFFFFLPNSLNNATSSIGKSSWIGEDAISVLCRRPNVNNSTFLNKRKYSMPQIQDQYLEIDKSSPLNSVNLNIADSLLSDNLGQEGYPISSTSRLETQYQNSVFPVSLNEATTLKNKDSDHGSTILDRELCSKEFDFPSGDALLPERKKLRRSCETKNTLSEQKQRRALVNNASIYLKGLYLTMSPIQKEIESFNIQFQGVYMPTDFIRFIRYENV